MGDSSDHSPQHWNRAESLAERRIISKEGSW